MKVNVVMNTKVAFRELQKGAVFMYDCALCIKIGSVFVAVGVGTMKRNAVVIHPGLYDGLMAPPEGSLIDVDCETKVLPVKELTAVAG